MSQVSINEDELAAVLAEVERELVGYLKPDLAKAEDGKPDDDQGSAPPDASPEASAPEAPAADGPPSPAPDAAPAADGAPPAADEGSAPADPAQEQGPMDVNALTAEYSKLPPEELKMHYIASKAALMQTMQAAQGAGAGGPPPDASAPPSPAGSPAPDAPPAAPPAPEGPPMALKNEMKPAPVPMAKSEGLSKAEADDLRAQIEGLTKAVTIVLGAPQRKAVTSLAFLAKSEEPAKTLSKAEVDAKLKDKIRTNLSKSDRALINQFTLNQIDVSKIEHLLK